MNAYQELSLDAPKEHRALREAAQRFAKAVMRPATIGLDRTAAPKGMRVQP